jgi:sec-independent protein translocase protein TatA
MAQARAPGSLIENGPPTLRPAVSSSSFSIDKRNHSDTRNLSMMPFAFLPNLGPMELMIVAFISLLIFGNRLPSVMRSLGKSVTEFKKGVSGIEEEIDQAVTSEKKVPPAA